MVRALVVDDETLARQILIEHLSAVPDLEVIGQAANGFEAVKLAEEHSPDLIFLDIQMPKLSGFEVLELLGERAPAVVFTTAYDEFALRAFEVHAVDYLLKPVEPARLVDAVERARQRLANRTPAPSAEQLSVSARPPGKTLERILIRHEGRVHVLPLERIDYIEAQDDYLSFSCNGKHLRKQQTMSDLENQLDPTRFIRIHRSFILNIERLARIDLYGKDSWLAILADGSKLPMSRTGHAKLKELIG
jgi:two-component system, LytTR family, response regulator